MRFVDRQQSDADAAAPPRQSGDCETARERRKPADIRLPPPAGAAAVTSSGESVLLMNVAGKPKRRELIDLIFHQGNQRRNDKRDPRLDDGRQLVAETFAPAGRHDAKTVVASQNRFDHLALPRPKRRQTERAEIALQIALRCQGHDRLLEGRKRVRGAEHGARQTACGMQPSALYGPLPASCKSPARGTEWAFCAKPVNRRIAACGLGPRSRFGELAGAAVDLDWPVRLE